MKKLKKDSGVRGAEGGLRGIIFYTCFKLESVFGKMEACKKLQDSATPT